MKKLFVLSVSTVLFGAAGWAAPCIPGTLASYIALGSAGCVLGNLDVSGFAYQAKAGGGAAKITADQIMVTPLLAPVGSFALQFSAPWSVQMGQSQLSGITYKVLSSISTVQVQQARLDGAGFQAGMFGSVVVNETLATTSSSSSLQVFLKCTELCRTQTSVMETFTPPSPMLVVSDQVTLKSTLGQVSMSSFADWFVTCQACV